MARVEFGGDDGAIIAASFVEQMNRCVLMTGLWCDAEITAKQMVTSIIVPYPQETFKPFSIHQDLSAPPFNYGFPQFLVWLALFYLPLRIHSHNLLAIPY